VSALTIPLAAVAVILAVLAILALRFPRGRADWPLDSTATGFLALSVTMLVILLIAVYFATRQLQWPPAVITAGLGSALAIGALAIVSLLLPRGVPRR